MASIREIIKEATTRINLVPRKQAVPGDILESAYKLLKGIVNKYNYDNLLVWTQNSILVRNVEYTHIYDETDTVKGRNNLYFPSVEALEAYTPSAEEYEKGTWAMVEGVEDTVYIVYSPALDVYDWRAQTIHDYLNPRIQEMQKYMAMNHICIRDVAKINSVYVVTDVGQPYKLYFELKFIPANEFDNYTNDANVFTVTEKSEGEWVMRVKPCVYRLGDRRLKVNYNEAIQFDLDSELYIPDNYVELLIVALAHKLALQYPRLDDAQMQRLENEVRVLVDNVRTPKAVNRMVLRDRYDYDYLNSTMTQAELLAGSWF
jgi:hypothetical protein